MAAAKALTLDDLCKMTKAELQDTAAEFEITLTTTKRSDILSELISKLHVPVPSDRPTSVSKLLESYPDPDEAKGAKPKTTAEKPPSSHGSIDGDVFKDDPNVITLEYEKIQLERERFAFESHRADIERQRERENAEIERQKAELELTRLRELHKHELEMKNLELQMQRATAIAAAAAGNNITGPQLQTARVEHFRVVDAARMVPKFDPSDLENYLLSFERICTVNAWPRDYWSAILQTQLAGKALKVFAELSEQDCSNYDMLKKALLVAYELCPEVYRKRFRSFTKLTHDTYADFAFKLHNVFKRWLEGVKAHDDIEALRQTMLLEQFFSVLPDELKLWLTDQKPKTLPQAAQLADQYVALHKSVSQKTNGQGSKVESTSDPNMCAYVSKNFHNSEKKFFTKKHNFGGNIVCFKCHKRGHLSSQCRTKQKGANQASTNVVSQQDVEPPQEVTNVVQSVTLPVAEINTVHPLFEPYCNVGYIVNASGDRHEINILRDTAALQSLMSKSCIPSDFVIHLDEVRWIRGISGNIMEIPLVQVWLESKFCNENVTLGLVDTLPDGVDLLLGNDLFCKFSRDACDNLPDYVITRSMTNRSNVIAQQSMQTNDDSVPDNATLQDVHKLFKDDNSCAVDESLSNANDHINDDEQQSSNELSDNSNNTDTSCRNDMHFGDIDLSSVVSCKEFISLQQNDKSLAALFDLAENEPYPLNKSYIFVKDGLLMRREISKSNHDISYEQLVVPAALRNKLLWLAHDIPASGHLGVKKTKFRLTRHFWWPKCSKDIYQYVTSCDICQRVGKGSKPKPAPLIPLPIISEPFEKVAIDIVGPLPTTAAGNRFILTIIDLGSLYPEAIPLPSHTAADVATALSQVFSRFGFPETILSDQAPDFMSQLMQVFLHDFNITQIRCSVYHPQSNGTLERFHRTLKSMLRTLVDKYEMDWDNCLNWSLFAFREVPVESLGFSPFELLFGRDVKGPLHLMKSLWSKDLLDLTNAKPNVIDYMLDLRSRLQECREAALENTKKAREKSKRWYNNKAVPRSFQPGDKVLVLLPIPGNPLKAKYQGPYTILSRVGQVDYWIEMPDKRKSSRLLHVNLLKRYKERDAKFTQCVSVDPVVSVPVQLTDEVSIDCGPDTSSVVDDFQLDHLSDDQRPELSQLLNEFSSVFSDQPGRTTVANHHIELKPGSKPVRQSPYRVNPKKQISFK